MIFLALSSLSFIYRVFTVKMCVLFSRMLSNYMSKVKIIYGSCGGNTELVCEKVADVLKERGHQSMLVRAKGARAEDISDCDLFIFASPTYGHGELEIYIEKFLGNMKDVNMEGLKTAVISLGDIKYEADYFLESAKTLTEFLQNKKANIIAEPLKIAKSPIPHLETLITKWAEKISELI